MTNEMPQVPSGGEAMSVKVVKLMDYRIKEEYISAVLKDVSAETGIEVTYLLNKYKGSPVGLEIVVPSACEEADIEKVKDALIKRDDQVKELIKKSISDVGGQV